MIFDASDMTEQDYESVYYGFTLVAVLTRRYYVPPIPA